MTQDAAGSLDGPRDAAGDGSRDGASAAPDVAAGTPWWGEPWAAPGAAGGAADGTSGSEQPAGPGSAGLGGGTHTPGGPRTSLLVLIAIVALLAGGAGAAVGVTVGRDHAARGAQTVAVSSSVTASGGGGQNAIEAVAAALSPTVVLITEQVTEAQGQLVGTGSGVVVDAAKGYILTNNHVVSAYATGGGTLTVTTMAGRTVPATVVGRDPTADIAVIHVSLPGLTQARMGNSNAIKVGQTVVAFGAPLGLQGTVTSGIVSALHRPVSTQDTTSGTTGSAATQATIDAIQTDAAINPGNSGGALVDLSGAVIGINSAIASLAGASSGPGTESGSIGVGFAIPINEALYTANQLIATGHAVHAIIGVALSATSGVTTTSGATVAAVTPGGPAARAGIAKGDVIVAIDGAPIPDADAAIVAVRANHKPGDIVTITVNRGGRTLTLHVTLGASAPS